MIDIAQGFGVVFSANFYLLGQFYFISTNWFVLTFIDDLNACIRNLNGDGISIIKNFIEIVKFHEKILKKQNQIAKFMSTLISMFNISVQVIIFSTMYQIYIVSFD